MKRFFIKLLLWIGLALIPIHGCKACLETERTALLEIKSFFISISDIGYEDLILPSWVDHDDGMSSDCCNAWEGVKCNTTTRRVTDLSLRYTRIHYPFNYYDGAVPLLNLSLFRPFDELQSLDVSRNEFEGFYENKAYYGFGILKQLKVLDLRYNYFNDNILPYLNKLTSLNSLFLRQNNIEGSNPKEGLTNLINLKKLDLISNRITSGSIKRLGLANLTELEVLDLSVNRISESITELGLANFRNLKALGLSYNKLNGSLESQGSIPESFFNLKMIESLDLSHNKLRGRVSPRLTELNFLSNFNVSYNNLSGLVPDKGQFATFDESNYRGNIYLCGPVINKSCNSAEEILATTSNREEDEDETAIDMVSFNWSFTASYVTFWGYLRSCG